MNNTNQSVKGKFEGLFTPLMNTRPYIKMAFEGFAGTGKSWTAGLCATGLHKDINSSKPIAYVDTEDSAKFLKPKIFDPAKVQVFVNTSRSLADLVRVIEACEEGYADILIVDSLTHIWENFLQGYREKFRRDRFYFQDWGIIKPAWKKQFSDRFLRAKCHIILCGRAGYEYDYTETGEKDEAGKARLELTKTGIKMKVEGETAYEPNQLILMQRFEEVLGDEKKIWREATVIKDKAGVIDGKTFVNPTWQNFKPAYEMLTVEVGSGEDSPETPPDALFEKFEDKWKEKEIALEKIEGLMVSIAPGQTSKEKKWKTDVLQKVFATRSWEEIKRKSVSELQAGLEALEKEKLELQAEYAAL